MKITKSSERKVRKTQTVNICRSETWMGDNFIEISTILEQTIKEFMKKDERIINIEVKERAGLSRFWIYSIL